MVTASSSERLALWAAHGLFNELFGISIERWTAKPTTIQSTEVQHVQRAVTVVRRGILSTVRAD